MFFTEVSQRYKMINFRKATPNKIYLMKVLKRILNYTITTLISFLCAFTYMRIILGSKSKHTDSMAKLFNIIYDLAFVYVGLILGSIIALLYILSDLIYFKTKLRSHTNPTGVRLLIILIIAIFITTTHYILETVIDVI